MENVSQRNEQADVEVSRLDLESGEDIRRGNSGRGDGSMRFSRRESSTLIEEIESVKAAEAGDDGGRSFHVADIESSRENMPNGGGGTNCMGMGVSVPDDVLIFAHAFRPTTNAESAAWNWSPVSPLPSDIVSPFSDCPLMADRSAADVHNTAWESRQTEVKSNNSKMVIEGLKLGFLGCMSTVSSFITEVHALHQSSYPWRAYAYISFTLFPALVLGTLIYSVPIWMKGYSY